MIEFLIVFRQQCCRGEIATNIEKHEGIFNKYVVEEQKLNFALQLIRSRSARLLLTMLCTVILCFFLMIVSAN